MKEPKAKITYKKGGHVKIVITCDYPANKSYNTAQRVWDIVSDFSGIKTVFPLIVRNYMTYPDDKQTEVGTIRDMTFGGKKLTIGIEQLTKIDKKKRSITYISMYGLPVSNYVGTMKVSGKNACTLIWTITYDQLPIDKKFANFMAGLFVNGEMEIGRVIGVK
jgi:hypothetical protein